MAESAAVQLDGGDNGKDESNKVKTTEEFLRDDCGVCSSCVSLLLASARIEHEVDDVPNNKEDEDEDGTTVSWVCQVCLGLQSKAFETEWEERIREGIEPYGGFSQRFLSEPPSLRLPGAILLRAHCAISAAARPASSPGVTILASEFGSRLRERLRHNMHQYVRSQIIKTNTLPQEESGVPQQEEQGCLALHQLVWVKSEGVPAPVTILPSACRVSQKSKKRRRFRGNDPTEKQGGDPRSNLEGRCMRTIDDETNNLSTGHVQTVLNNPLGRRSEITQQLGQWLLDLVKKDKSTSNSSTGSSELLSSLVPISSQVAVWRTNFYVKSRYTKSRRDVSQTPFYVPSGHGSMVRKGITSVEEEICPVLASVACGGISQHNNEIMGDSIGRGGKIVYGMAKFHASGREDMDVRMLLPPPNMIQTTKSSEDSIEVGGRPFVCEIIDAFRMPTTRDLQNVVDTINQTNTHDDEQEEPEEEEYTFVDGLFVKDDSSKNIRTKRQYGQNPNGVGIAQPLVFTSAKSFSTLQADTETKVKYYGCVCWSARPISTQQELEQCFPPNSYPLEIKQNTPIRVLHRRSAAIRIRHVLSLRCERKSDHWFILHISTSAGTYVKEFVHGDLGRTTPSISSILGCKTDIVQLDCEGIAGV